jgi:hypothetical protein
MNAPLIAVVVSALSALVAVALIVWLVLIYRHPRLTPGDSVVHTASTAAPEAVNLISLGDGSRRAKFRGTVVALALAAGLLAVTSTISGAIAAIESTMFWSRVPHNESGPPGGVPGQFMPVPVISPPSEAAVMHISQAISAIAPAGGSSNPVVKYLEAARAMLQGQPGEAIAKTVEAVETIRQRSQSEKTQFDALAHQLSSPEPVASLPPPAAPATASKGTSGVR